MKSRLDAILGRHAYTFKFIGSKAVECAECGKWAKQARDGDIDCQWCRRQAFDLDDVEAPTCPRCGYEDDEWGEWGRSIRDDALLEYECASCEKEFRVRVSITTTFTTQEE